MTGIVNILIVDDHTIFRSGLSKLLSEQVTCQGVCEASNIEEACAQLESHQNVSVIILDINLSGQNALDHIPSLRELRPEIPILIMSMYPAQQFAPAAYKAGANAYLTKDASPKDLTQALAAVAKGDVWQHPEVQSILGCQSRGTAPHERLSEKELIILKRIANGEALLDISNDMFLSNKTISTHRRRILEKMNMSNNAELIKYALQNGLVV